jgi:hypothetical protein
MKVEEIDVVICEGGTMARVWCAGRVGRLTVEGCVTAVVSSHFRFFLVLHCVVGQGGRWTLFNHRR